MLQVATTYYRLQDSSSVSTQHDTLHAPPPRAHPLASRPAHLLSITKRNLKSPHSAVISCSLTFDQSHPP